MSDRPGIVFTIPDLPATAPGATEIALPSGAVAVIRQGTGKDLRIAQMACGQPFDALKFEYALISQVATLDGKRVTLEQVEAMRIDDVLELQAAVNRVNFPTKAPPDEAKS